MRFLVLQQYILECCVLVQVALHYVESLCVVSWFCVISSYCVVLCALQCMVLYSRCRAFSALHCMEFHFIAFHFFSFRFSASDNIIVLTCLQTLTNTKLHSHSNIFASLSRILWHVVAPGQHPCLCACATDQQQGETSRTRRPPFVQHCLFST